MTTIIDVMLDVARLVDAVQESTASASGTTTTLPDTVNIMPTEYFTGGTIFFTSGANIGLYKKIDSYANNTFTWTGALTAIASGVSYAAVRSLFPSWLLKMSVTQALYSSNIMQINSALAGIANTTSYALPTGVTSVRRVIVDDKINYHWQEVNGYLYFDTNYEPSAGDTIKIWYCSKHPTLAAETTAINTAVDLEWLKWSAVAFCWRNTIEVTYKDNPVAVELLNEAKTTEAVAKQVAALHSIRQMPIDPHHGAL